MAEARQYESKWLKARGVKPPPTKRQVIIRLVRYALLIIVIATTAICYLAQPIVEPDRRTIPVHASADRLRRYVTTLAEDFAPRAWRRFEQLDRAAVWIRDSFDAAGVAADFQEYAVEGQRVRNVLTSVGPTNGPRIVIGAHYDACMPGPGADDNASGVAGLLELARMFKEAPPATRVDLVAYTLEEPPFFRSAFMGSRVHAVGLVEAKVEVRLMISLEMIGYFDDRRGSQRYPLSALGCIYPSAGNYITVVGAIGDGLLVRRFKREMAATTDVPVWSINAPRGLSGIDLSDHRSYWDQGFPALMITDTAFYRNANYHKATDTPDTLDYDRMAKVVDGIFGAVSAFAAHQ